MRKGTTGRKIKYALIKSGRTLKKRGLSGLVRKLLRKIKYLAFRTTSSLWFEKRLDEYKDPVTPKIGVDVQFLIEEKSGFIQWLKEQRDFFPWIYFENELKVAQNNGHIFAVITHGEKIIGYIKIGINRIYIRDFDRTVRFPSDIAFIYDTFVLPSHRQMHLANFALDKTVEYLKERDYKKILCHIENWNHPSLRLYRKNDFKEFGTIRFSRIFGIPVFVLNGHRPFVNFETFIGRKLSLT